MTTSIEQRLSELPPLTAGQHYSLDDGVCAMEAAAYLAGEPWTDNPECVCPTIGAFLRAWNDDLPDADRDRLIRPLIPRIIGSRSMRAVEERRSWIALDWLIRERAPAWLGLTPGLESHAAEMRELTEVRDVETVSAAQPVLTAASDAARDAWVKVRDAASDADAWAAASDAVWIATRAASRAAASDAARAAARAASRAVASDAVWIAASDAASDAARAAAWAAARAVASDAVWIATWAATAAASDAASDAARDVARDVARDAARATLAPTVVTQQQSALRLIDRMLVVTDEATT